MDDDVDGARNRDDSGTPRDGKCSPTYCNPHGTSMLGAVAGAYLGTSKKIKPILVRVPRRRVQGGGSTPEDYLNGVAKVVDAVGESDSATVRAILNLAWVYPRDVFGGALGEPNPAVRTPEEEMKHDEAYDRWKESLHHHIAHLVKQGVFVVCGSGNSFVASSPYFTPSRNRRSNIRFRLMATPPSSLIKMTSITFPNC